MQILPPNSPVHPAGSHGLQAPCHQGFKAPLIGGITRLRDFSGKLAGGCEARINKVRGIFSRMTWGARPILSSFILGASAMVANVARADDDLDIKIDYSNEGFWISVILSSLIAIGGPLLLIHSVSSEQMLLNKANNYRYRIETSGDQPDNQTFVSLTLAMTNVLTKLCRKDAQTFLDNRKELQNIFSKMLDGVESGITVFAHMILNVFLTVPYSSVARAALEDLFQMPLLDQKLFFSQTALQLLKLVHQHPEFGPAVCRLGLIAIECHDGGRIKHAKVNGAHDGHPFSREHIWDFLKLAETEPLALLVVAGMLKSFTEDEFKSFQKDPRWCPNKKMPWAGKTITIAGEGEPESLGNQLKTVMAIVGQQLSNSSHALGNSKLNGFRPKWDAAGLERTGSEETPVGEEPALGKVIQLIARKK